MQHEARFDRTPLDVVDAPQSVDVHLGVIEAALGDGDVEGAQATLRMVRRALRRMATSAPPVAPDLAGGVALTGQEIAALRQLPDGSLSQKDMARAMGVSRNTLKSHLKSLYLKLGVHCRAEAIHRAREIGLVPPTVTLVPLLPSDDQRIA